MIKDVAFILVMIAEVFETRPLYKYTHTNTLYKIYIKLLSLKFTNFKCNQWNSDVEGSRQKQ